MTASSPPSASKKKLYQFHPLRRGPSLDTYRTLQKNRREKADPLSVERGVRQLLADKISGNLIGLWLLVPEHLRLGTWSLLRQWAGDSQPDLDSRLALQLVHEAALGVSSTRASRCLSQKGFEILNGLPFVASDQAVHDLLDAHTIQQAQHLQIVLGCLRRARGHFRGRLLAIDPHRMRSSSKRQMPRHCDHPGEKPRKLSQLFFCLDADTFQPVCLTLGSSAVKVSQATPELLQMAQLILNPASSDRPLVLSDNEHSIQSLFQWTLRHSPFDLLAPMSNTKPLQKSLREIPPDRFMPRWAGWATTHRDFSFGNSPDDVYCQLVQRAGETSQEFHFKAFLATRFRDEVESLALDFPKRWHIEEFFNAYQQMGWKRAGTLNLHIRYAQATMALLAQAACHQLRARLNHPFATWDAPHFASAIFRGMDGDLRVHNGDTILVTIYNAPQAETLRPHFENLPSLLQSEGIDPHIPWLYNYKLDFRFK